MGSVQYTGGYRALGPWTSEQRSDASTDSRRTPHAPQAPLRDSSYANVMATIGAVRRARYRHCLRGQHGRAAPTSSTAQVKSVDIGDGEIESRRRQGPELDQHLRRVDSFLGADVVDGTLTGADIGDGSLKDEDIGQSTFVDFAATIGPSAARSLLTRLRSPGVNAKAITSCSRPTQTMRPAGSSTASSTGPGQETRILRRATATTPPSHDGTHALQPARDRRPVDGRAQDLRRAARALPLAAGVCGGGYSAGDVAGERGGSWRTPPREAFTRRDFDAASAGPPRAGVARPGIRGALRGWSRV